MKKLTIVDIAKMAGVGTTTVSRYFNGGNLKKETRERIKEIVDKYNYTPNTFAKALKSTDNLYDFAILYGENKLYEMPENLVKNVVRTNKIVEKQDNTGGWVYDQMKGEIKPNIEIGKPSKPKKQKK